LLSFLSGDATGFAEIRDGIAAFSPETLPCRRDETPDDGTKTVDVVGRSSCHRQPG
jgi:hypothetical protein